MHYWADLQSVHGFHCYDNIAPNTKCQLVLVGLLAVCLVVTAYSCGAIPTINPRLHSTVIKSVISKYMQHGREMSRGFVRK